MQWPLSEKFMYDDANVFSAGWGKHERGVGSLFSKEAARAIVSWESVIE